MSIKIIYNEADEVYFRDDVTQPAGVILHYEHTLECITAIPVWPTLSCTLPPTHNSSASSIDEEEESHAALSHYSFPSHSDEFTRNAIPLMMDTVTP